MKIPLFSKIFSGYLLIIVILSILIPFFSFKLIKTHYINTTADNFKNIALTLKPEITVFIEKKDFKGLDSYLKGLKTQINTRVTVVDRDGRVLADAERDPKTMENHRIRPEIANALADGIGKSMRFSVTVEEEMLYVALPIEKDGRFSWVIRVSSPLKQVNFLLSELKIHILWLAIFMSVLSLAIAFVLSRGVSGPVKTLVQSVRKISQGNFDAKIFLKNENELKDLGDSINNMREQMRELFSDITGRNEELDTIISSMHEPLVVINRDGVAKLSNESFKKLAGNNGITGKYYWEVVRSPGLAELIRKVDADNLYCSDEVKVKEKIFIASVNYLVSRNETVIVLHDITDLKNLEKIKKDFVANLSHELRTPLTAIKGFVETLEEEEDIRNRRYLEIIKRHTDRLMNIVRDLLTLSELEGKGETIEREDVYLVNVFESVLKIFENRIKEKGLTIRLNISDAIPRIKVDPFKIEQVLINLIDNAIKYTEAGEIAISVTGSETGVSIKISDSGIGIPQDHLPRIFERFYVVDKSRSKKLGGTGLGLSIVKHIVNLHNGKIDVESAPGKGTSFTVHLPGYV